MRALVSYVYVVLIAGICTNADATLVRWTLHNVAFDDGGTASGYFIVDTDTRDLALTDPLPDDPLQQVGGFEIITTRGSRLPGGYHFPAWWGTGHQIHTVDMDHVIAYWDRTGLGAVELRLNIESNWWMKTTGSFAILPGAPGCDPLAGHACSGESYFGWDPSVGDVYEIRSVLPGGTLRATVVPEASTPIMFAFGLGALALTSRRKRARHASMRTALT